jgi:hypothetical protein
VVALVIAPSIAMTETTGESRKLQDKIEINATKDIHQTALHTLHNTSTSISFLLHKIELESPYKSELNFQNTGEIKLMATFKKQIFRTPDKRTIVASTSS